MKFIVDETNRFHQYEIRIILHISCRLFKWRDTALEEMYCFLAVSLLLPHVRKLTLNKYWSKDTLLATPVFGKIMSRDRYLILLRMLHFCNNDVAHDGDRLIKIRRIVDDIRKIFMTYPSPYENLCIDESLLLFKGRLFFKQYIPSKRNRFGIKMFVLCDCVTGYILDFIIYTGSASDIQNYELGRSGDIVAILVHPYLQKGHTVYVDNRYTSPALFTWLHERQTLVAQRGKIGRTCRVKD